MQSGLQYGAVMPQNGHSLVASVEPYVQALPLKIATVSSWTEILLMVVAPVFANVEICLGVGRRKILRNLRHLKKSIIDSTCNGCSSAIFVPQ